jgi:dihydrodipicolinate synthase/N-acetylneuraminate lyase
VSETDRRDLQRRLFPEGVPRLWCPPLTHYDRDGGIDHVRCAAHLAFIARWSRGWLVPGSTGDAWELTTQETQEVVDLALLEAARVDAKVLVGALHPDAAEAARVVRDTSARVGAEWGAGSLTGSVGSAGPGTSDRFSADRFDGALCGFAACPPRGDDLTQEEIGSALGELLSLGAPLALYQLPQVTENEMGPDLVASLAHRFPNFVLFKDTSGADRVTIAQAAGLDLEGVFLVRGAEGGYAAHLRPNGGGYDGLLLSTANSFGAQLSSIIDLSLYGRRVEADELSSRLSALVTELFAVVGQVSDGNPFANAAKAADHFFAHGPRALVAPPPRLHAGSVLPREVLAATRDALRRYDLLPVHGYLG